MWCCAWTFRTPHHRCKISLRLYKGHIVLVRLAKDNMQGLPDPEMVMPSAMNLLSVTPYRVQCRFLRSRWLQT